MRIGFRAPACGADWGWKQCGVLVRTLPVWAPQGDAARQALRKRLEEWFEGRVTLWNSGRSALEAALRSVARQAGGQGSVLVPALICRAVPDKVVRCGLRPAFYDVGPDMSPCMRSLEQAWRRDTVAVIYAHLYGVVKNVRQAAELCRQRGVAFIEDCAAAFLLRDETGQMAGRQGDYAVFSFQQGKTVVAGSGGALVERGAAGEGEIQPPEWSAKEQWQLWESKVEFLLRRNWAATSYLWGRLDGSRRSYADRTQEALRPMSRLDAALIEAQIDDWPRQWSRKLEIVKRYARNLEGLPLRLPQYREGRFIGRLFVQYPGAVVQRRAKDSYVSAVVDYLRGQGVQAQLTYYPAHRLEAFSVWAEGAVSCAEALACSAIEVPAQTRLKDHQIDFVCEKLLASLRLAG